MTSIRNEHIVWGYGEREDGKGHVVICGITDHGLKYLKDQPGHTLVINPPMTFANVSQIIVFGAKDKAELKDLFRKAGMVVSEVN